VVLLDTGAGISDVVLFSVSLASEVLIVATPEPTSLTDAYAAIKVLAMQQKRQHVRMVINQAARPGDGRAITSQLQQVLDRFVTTESGRARAPDPHGRHSGRPRRARCRHAPPAAAAATPGCPAALAIAQLANKIEKRCCAHCVVALRLCSGAARHSGRLVWCLRSNCNYFGEC
jgi:flagellar biosynthesis protein FlhG